MKIKAIDFSKTSASNPSRKNKCWTSYHKWLNHRKCNKLMTVIFCVSILTLFIGMVTITIIRTEVTTHELRMIEDNTCDCCNEFEVNNFALKNVEADALSDVVSPCTIAGCVVTCRDVADENLSDEILTLDSELNECSNVDLALYECRFVNDGIKAKWLSELNIQVSKLEIFQSNLKHILTDAFNSDAFRASLLTLTIDNGLYDPTDPLVYQFIGKGSFEGLTSLSILTISNHPNLKVLDEEDFKYLSESLTQLKITQIANPWAPTTLLSAVKFKQLTTIDLQSNNIPTLNTLSFKGIADYAKTLILTKSKVETISEKTFDNFKTLQFLYLQNNLLKTIPPELFNSLLKITGFKVTLSSNLWDCQCDLSFLKDLIIENQTAFPGENIKCKTPLELENIKVIQADLCPEPIDTTVPHSISSASMPDDGTTTITVLSTNLITVETSDPSTEPPTETPTDPPTEPPTDTPTEPPTNAPTDPPTQPPTDTPTEPPTNAPTDPPTQPPTELPTDAPTDSPTQPPTDPPTETPTDPPTEPPTDPPTDTPTDSPTQPPTDPPTDTPTDSPTQPPTDPPTDAPTDSPTQPPTDPPTETPTDPPGTNSSTSRPPSTTRLTTTTHSTSYARIDIDCYRGTIQSRNWNWTFEDNIRDSRISYPTLNETLELIRPTMTFEFRDNEAESEVNVEFDGTFDLFLVYYPGFLDASKLDSEDVQKNVHCQIVATPNILIRNLIPSTVYTFCALMRYDLIQSPFQCKSYQTQTPFNSRTWIYQGQKVVILTSFLLLLLLSLVMGAVMTYLLIRRIPRLMKGSKRVVMVSNATKDVMVMPSGSRNNSWQKEASAPSIKNEAPTYMTPLPRQSFDNKPQFARSLSDTSLRSASSYVCVSRSPPRFSQVFLPSDFKHELPRRCGSFPHCQPPSCQQPASCQPPSCQPPPSCHSPDPIPPPLPRRSIASSASSFEMRKPSNNSIYRRQPSRIDDETENHYNFIV